MFLGRSNKCLFLSLVLLNCKVLVLVIVYSAYILPERREFLQGATTFAVDTPACRIIDLNPFDKSILRNIGHNKIVCPETGYMTYVDGAFLRLNRTYIASQLGDRFSHCRHQRITRPKPEDSSFAYGQLGANFSADVRVKDEFIRVFCYNGSGKVVHANFHAFVLTKPSVEERCMEQHRTHLQRHKPREVLSVQMVGTDSMSRSNVVRQWPQTRRFLLDQLGAVEMLGYNKVGLNTFPNVVPLLSGRHVQELPWNRSMANTVPFNRYTFLWDVYSQAGYRTLYAEDETWMASFNYLKKGFADPPTDYYLRALIMAMSREKEHPVWKRHCVHHQQLTEFVLSYPAAFSRLFRNNPHLAFTFLTHLTHDVQNNAGAADGIYLSFLRTLKSEGLFNNTVLVFFSDHGMRFGSMRKTPVGRAEDSLPYMSLAFPGWFQQRYPRLMANLRLNSRRLTTAFDVHATLKHLLYFDGKAREAGVQERGISLLTAVPDSRNCSHAGVPPEYCMCLGTRLLSKSSPLARRAGMEVARSINLLLAQPRAALCANLSLENVHSAEELLGNSLEHSGTDGEGIMYRLIIGTKPGAGQFEAMLKYNTKLESFSLVGEISRINRYGHLKKCVNDFSLEKYCYCKELVRERGELETRDQK